MQSLEGVSRPGAGRDERFRITSPLPEDGLTRPDKVARSDAGNESKMVPRDVSFLLSHVAWRGRFFNFGGNHAIIKNVWATI